MVEVWQIARTEIILIAFMILSGVIGGLVWGKHTVQAPFRERRLQKRTLFQRIKWQWSHRIKPTLVKA